MIRHNGSAIPSAKPTFIVIVGPQGCGKTCNAELLKGMFGCESVLDNWSGSSKELLDCASHSSRCRAAGKEVPPGYGGMRILVLWTADPDEIVNKAFHMTRNFMAREGFDVKLLMFRDIEDSLNRASGCQKSNEGSTLTVSLTPKDGRQEAFVNVVSNSRFDTITLQQATVTPLTREAGLALAKQLVQHFAISPEELHEARSA